ncbi:MAG: ScyD/ScyE family protein [Synechococcaceae cyanobacterium]|nr:ScyD/ScyE family protein [Synechococcaceae cyanobacterium]
MAILALFSPLLIQAAEAAQAYKVRLLAQGLNNPRGLLVHGPRVLVSEAGSGPQSGSSGSPCILAGSGATLCQGLTGAIGAWDSLSGSYSRLITGLPSLAESNGTEGTGIADLTWHGSTGLVGVFGLGGDPNQPSASLLSPLFGQVVTIDLASGQLTPRSNLAAYEKTVNPDSNTKDINSNPYAIQSFGNQLYATDAGGNTLLAIDPSSSDPGGNFPVTSHFVFPRIDVMLGPPFIPGPPVPYKAAAVPTGLAAKVLGTQLNIGEFTGVPFEAGSASVFSLDATATAPTQDLTGFTMITDVAAGDDDSLYILEYASNLFQRAPSGSIWLVDPTGARSQIITGLFKPTGIAVGPGGVLYVTNNADGTEGELLQFTPVPGPLPLFGAWAAWLRSRGLRQRRRQPLRQRRSNRNGGR